MNLLLRIILFLAIVVYFVFVFHLLKRRRLDIKYTLLWLLLGAVMLAFNIKPNLLTVISKMFGIVDEVNALFLIALAAITIILMAITSIVSGQKEAIKILVQKNGMLENRIKQLEEKLKEEE